MFKQILRNYLIKLNISNWRDLLTIHTLIDLLFFPTKVLSETKTVVVLGIHRSATSMVARALHKSREVWMGHQLLMGKEHNPMGHYEQLSVLTLNSQILNAADGSWSHPPKPEKIANSLKKKGWI